jgi:hypothetical protein
VDQYLSIFSFLFVSQSNRRIHFNGSARRHETCRQRDGNQSDGHRYERDGIGWAHLPQIIPQKTREWFGGIELTPFGFSEHNSAIDVPQ